MEGQDCPVTLPEACWEWEGDDFGTGFKMATFTLQCCTAWLSALLRVSKMADPVLSQCSSGGKAISWWCLCSSAPNGGGNILTWYKMAAQVLAAV